MDISEDTAGQKYIEIPTVGNEAIRVTLVKKVEWTGLKMPVDCIRIQVKDESGHLRQGPEIPEHIMVAVSRGINELMKYNIKQD